MPRPVATTWAAGRPDAEVLCSPLATAREGSRYGRCSYSCTGCRCGAGRQTVSRLAPAPVHCRS
eukprot:16018583-Heterocapsa_arctica.AAC.1